MRSQPFYYDENDPPAKRRIVEESLRLFAERGLSATSIRDIADAAGYTNPALYKHFKTKEALALMLFERSYKELFARIAEALKGQRGFEERFCAFLKAFADFYDAYPDALVFAFDNLSTLWPQVSGTISKKTIITLTRELLQQGRREGIVATDADLSLQITLVIGMVGQLTRQLYLGTLKGPAAKYVTKTERILRAGLS